MIQNMSLLLYHIFDRFSGNYKLGV